MVNNLAPVKRDVPALIPLHQLIVHVPEGFRLDVDGLSFQPVQVCLNGCLQHFLSRLRLISRQTLDLFPVCFSTNRQSWLSQFDGHDSPPSV